MWACLPHLTWTVCLPMVETGQWKALRYKYQTPKHPECFISTELSQWNILHHSHLWSRWAIKRGSECFWLGWWRSELVVAHRLLARLDEDALHGAPPVVLVGRSHGVHFTLTPDGVSILLPRHTQINAGAHVFETHVFVPLPVVAVTLHRPYVKVVPLAVVSERTDFLLTNKVEETDTICTVGFMGAGCEECWKFPKSWSGSV